MTEIEPTTPPLKIRMLKKMLENAETATGGFGRQFWLWFLGFAAIAPPGSALDIIVQTIFGMVI
jgi:hypothetical protein